MAFGNISTLYLPTTANAGASQWGTDVRKLLDAADAASDALTKTNHGTGAAVVRTFDPYTTAAADLDQSLYGWAISPTDMNSQAGARRRYPAGNHVATIRVGHTAATAKSANFSLHIYRVGPAPTRTRTLLGTANSGTVSIPGLAGELTVNITVALPEIIFEADETIQYSFEVGAAGTAITGDVITLFTGTQSAVAGRIATPQLSTTYEVSADLTGDGTVSREGLQVGVSRNLEGVGESTFARAVLASKSFDLEGDGAVTRLLAVAEDFDLVGDGEPTVSRAVVASKTFDLEGVGELTREPLEAQMARSVAGEGVVEPTKAVIAAKTFDLEGSGEITETHPVQAFRSFDLTGSGEILTSGANGSKIELPLDELPSDGGGTTIVKKPTFIFED